ncbi:Calcium-dependent protease [Halomicronema hongdechloris C2206]|uniref:Calcium-dependent protease n=2 Tax=Halomicronema hongdechloris TaxID=1209493 RepID=A0A1Z3HQ04_9CYAN|nr:Calcium-dependent protease [Halomicronema hongdechloris C2206]
MPQGVILQRGGEELLLEKVVDRFTTRLQDASQLQRLQSQWRPQSMRPVARGQLLEWVVPAHRLESTLAAARQDEAVRYASHVYRLVQSRQTYVYLTEELTLQVKETTLEAEVDAIAASLGLTLVKPLEGIPRAYVFALDQRASENPIKLANRLSQRPEVLLAEPNVVVQSALLYRPSDDRYSQQWHLNHSGGDELASHSHIDVEAAWEITRGSRSIVIAVTDDGFDLDHPDLQGLGKIVAPTDLRDQDALPLPLESHDNHGTAVAGLAIAEENGQGVVGVAPGCSVMPIRTTGYLDDESIERLFAAAMDQGAAVIVCSWSPASVYFPLSLRQRHALTKAATHGRHGKGCVIVFSAGNANRPVSGTVTEKGWPNQALKGDTTWLNGFAVHPDVITVSACTSLGQKAAYSNWGDAVAVAAPSNNAAPSMALPKLGTVATGPTISQWQPGRGMVTCDRTGSAGYGAESYTKRFGGTSSSCPVVAGVVGLMLSANPNLTAQQVRQILQSTADKIIDQRQDLQLGLSHGTYSKNGHSHWFGHGKVNAQRAVQAARQMAIMDRRSYRTLWLEQSIASPIPDADPNGVVSTLRCQESGRLEAIEVRVDIDHDFLGDLSLTLSSPSGHSVLLQGRTLGSKTQLQATYTHTTTPLLMTLLGDSAQGLWQLRIVDHAPHRHRQITSLGPRFGVELRPCQGRTEDGGRRTEDGGRRGEWMSEWVDGGVGVYSLAAFKKGEAYPQGLEPE